MTRRAAFGIAALAILRTAEVEAQPVPQLPPVEVIGVSPLIGSGVDRDTVPAEVHMLDAAALRRRGMPELIGTLDQRIGGVTLDSASGNPFQPTLLFHGYAASPLQGTPQGLAVYVNGMRFNQPFGDTVNWDLLPDVAIDRIDLVGSNPVFGLNALGGALNVRLRNGFTYQGAEVAAAAGSFARLQGEFQYGRQADNVATYVAATVLHQDGWRDLQSSDLQTVFADLGWRGPHAEVHFNVTGAQSNLNGPGTTPVDLLAVAPRAQFTAPNQIGNRYIAASLSGTADLGDTISLQGLAYYRYFQQQVANGNAPNDTPCNDGSGLLCSATGFSTTQGSAFIGDFLHGAQYGELDTQTTRTNAYGASAQLTDTATLLGRENHFVVGASFDGAATRFDGTSYVGGLSAYDRSFIGPAVVIDEPGINSPVSVAVSTASYGIYLTDTFHVTPRLAATLSGRLNAVFVDLTDQNGADLSGSHSYVHFNPAAGLTYRVNAWLTAYGGYAVATRAPTPAELSCAGPSNACSLANFFVGDPDLKQVVSGTFEAGLRGTFKPFEEAELHYSLALFRSDLYDDIAFVNSPTQGRAFFANIGQTRRQGLDAELQLKTGRWLAYVSYSYIDATYQSGFVEASGANPAADANGNITVHPGNHLPGIPAHQVKLGAYYNVTDKWMVGATAIFASGAYLFGDEANLTPPLAPYATLGLSTSYRVLPNFEIFAWGQNITNSPYSTYGTFSPTGSVVLAQAPGAANPRSYSPAAPLAVYGGVRVTF